MHRISVAGFFLIFLLPISRNIYGEKIHVSKQGNDNNPGTSAKPLLTIQKAASIAQPDDTIIVHKGIYREYVSPENGGISDSRRIVYKAAEGDEVIIKGSEVINNWKKLKEPGIWKADIPNTFFGGFNPYSDTVHGDWYDPRGRIRHSGSVYLNGHWMPEAVSLDELLVSSNINRLWFGKVGPDSTSIWAQFGKFNPNKQLVEINVRQSVFYPKDTGKNFITVQGFTMEQAATPWAPPTAEQIGLIGPHWSKGWIIENNIIRYSMCSGISLGKYGDKWDNTSSNSAEGYITTIERALQYGWTKGNVGNHIVRNNIISKCEQAGIAGSLGAVFSTITENTIFDINQENWLAGAEQAGIKIHAAVDVEISGNHIYKTSIGIWLDWMAQGTNVSGNLLHNNNRDLFVEVNHGPFVVENNIFLSDESLLLHSQGGAFCHNLFGGAIHTIVPYDPRQTPVLVPHSTKIFRLHDNPIGDEIFANNIFVQEGHLGRIDTALLPSRFTGNIYLNGIQPSSFEEIPLIDSRTTKQISLNKKEDGYYLNIVMDSTWRTGQKRNLITSKLLSKTAISWLPFENPDGSDLSLDKDYFDNPRQKENPMAGPFENFKNGSNSLKVY